jgi:hypothetical protein
MVAAFKGIARGGRISARVLLTVDVRVENILPRVEGFPCIPQVDA